MTRREEIIAEAKKHEYDWGIDVDRFDVPDIFAKGAEWADKTMIDKACEWMELRLVGTMGSEDAYEFLTKFRKAMEE